MALTLAPQVPFLVAEWRKPNAADFGTEGAISCSGVAQATRFFIGFLAQHRTARAVPLPKSVALGASHPVFHEFSRTSPDGSRRTATKVSGIGRAPDGSRYRKVSAISRALSVR